MWDTPAFGRVAFIGALTAVSLGGMADIRAALWEDATATTIGVTAGWTNKVDVADINGDGHVDILFANGGNYATPGTPEMNQVFIGDGTGGFTDVSATVLGSTPDLARVIKARDLSGDGIVDIFVGTTYQTQSRLYLGTGGGAFTEVTATHLPAVLASVGDVEVGDVDGDGDFDLVLANWGPGNPLSSSGGRTLLWLNQGAGVFVDATSAQMPATLVGWSWELELFDVDNDLDLDALISCKTCSGSFLFKNDGLGNFTETTGVVPQFSNNYDFEPMEVNGDKLIDVVTINDGPGLREHLFRGNGAGYTDVTNLYWPTSANLGFDDNAAVFLDHDSDGDADFLIGSLNGDDRLLINDGTGRFSLASNPFSGPATPGTLALALADLNGDHRIDVIQAQGEVASTDHVFLGVDVAPDTAAPEITILGTPGQVDMGDPVVIHVRAHDHKSPTLPHEWQSTTLLWQDPAGVDQQASMTWYGGYLWRGGFTTSDAGVITYRVCAIDRAGNNGCSVMRQIVVNDPTLLPDAGMGPADAGSGPIDAGVDAGVDAGMGVADAGARVPDAGPFGTPDAMPASDAMDASDANFDAMSVDAGRRPDPRPDGCGCQTEGPDQQTGWWLLALVWATMRRRS